MTRALRSKLARLALAGALSACWAFPASAYERDVHYGLTYWLALKAGFSEHEAQAIAVGDSRVDSGGPTAIDANLDYSCARPDAVAAKRVQERHYPAAQAVPSPPAERIVTAGSAVAKREIVRVLTTAKEHPGEMLSLFGEALHRYQDSWSHAGVPGVSDFGDALRCDARFSLSHPNARGGPDSHTADLTSSYPEAVVEMAKATSEALASYPTISGHARVVTPWTELVGSVRKFAHARSKAEKRDWAVSEGIKSVDFLEGITLQDGPGMEQLNFAHSLLPPLNVAVSMQHDAPQDEREFFDKFFSAWLVANEPDKRMREFMPRNGRGAVQTLARMRLLKLRDHGLTASMLHRSAALTRSDLSRIESWTRDSAAAIHPTSAADAFVPLVTRGAEPSPLLPFLLRSLGSDGAAPKRIIAITRLKHLPYDTEGWIAVKVEGGWKLDKVIVGVDQ
jgi:hypothetical protein